MNHEQAQAQAADAIRCTYTRTLRMGGVLPPVSLNLAPVGEVEADEFRYYRRRVNAVIDEMATNAAREPQTTHWNAVRVLELALGAPVPDLAFDRRDIFERFRNVSPAVRVATVQSYDGEDLGAVHFRLQIGYNMGLIPLATYHHESQRLTVKFDERHWGDELGLKSAQEIVAALQDGENTLAYADFTAAGFAQDLLWCLLVLNPRTARKYKAKPADGCEYNALGQPRAVSLPLAKFDELLQMVGYNSIQPYIKVIRTAEKARAKGLKYYIYKTQQIAAASLLTAETTKTVSCMTKDFLNLNVETEDGDRLASPLECYETGDHYAYVLTERPIKDGESNPPLMARTIAMCSYGCTTHFTHGGVYGDQMSCGNLKDYIEDTLEIKRRSDECVEVHGFETIHGEKVLPYIDGDYQECELERTFRDTSGNLKFAFVTLDGDRKDNCEEYWECDITYGLAELRYNTVECEVTGNTIDRCEAFYDDRLGGWVDNRFDDGSGQLDAYELLDYFR